MRTSILAAGAALSLALMASPAQAAYSDVCDTDTIQDMAPKGTTIAFAVREVFADRGHVGPGEIWGCRVMGYVTNTDPGPNKVLFTITLPDEFTGRYVYLGIGGAAGKIPDIPERLLARGYALAGSDAGTGAKSPADFSFMNDKGRLTDFLWRGVQSSATATQAITRAYYKKPDIKRYISGCSGGGQMGLGNARRFGGQNFDGFLVGATPWHASLYHPNIFRIAGHLQNHPEGWISPDLTKKANAAILAAYDDVDGAKDGIIHDPRAIRNFDTGILKKVGFTPAQIETFNLIRNTYKFPSGGPSGDGTHPGYPISDVSGWTRFILGTLPPPWPSTKGANTADLLRKGVPFTHIMADTKARSVNPDADYWKITDFKEIVRLTSKDGETMPFDDPMDFNALAASGAKMIVWHGVNDESMSYLESLAGYHALQKRFPNAGDWSRYIPVPGMWHCRGGTGPTDDAVEEMLDALVDWVEKGTPPTGIVAGRYTRDGGKERTFLLCPDPTQAYLKSPDLDPKDAANWICRAPAG
ncbi:MAG: tannase/feruloyl esterase family alpha/beta hydrolase [Sphingobium sp.]